jgi:hypothetical protein
MDLAALDQTLRHSAGAVLVDPGLIRRVIRRHRGAGGLVPHGRCYVLPRDDFAGLVEGHERPYRLEELPDELILIARPAPRDLAGRSARDIATRLWRAVFHARVHQVLDRKVAAGGLDEAEVRRRIQLIGQTEFDEIRAILRHDDLVLPPHGDREVYIEFAALYLELRNFAPGLLVTTFPGLAPEGGADAAVGLDVDAAALLGGKPSDVDEPASGTRLRRTTAPTFSAPMAFGADPASVRPVSKRGHERLMRRADSWRQRGNHVRAALLAARAASVSDESLARRAENAARDDMMALGRRVTRALRSAESDSQGKGADWTALLYLLCDRAAAEPATGAAPESHLLYELQAAALAWEREERAVDVATWMLSWGKRPVVRPLATREVNVTRHLHEAERRLRNVRLPPADRKLLQKLLAWAAERADRNLRVALRPRVRDVLAKVGLEPRSTPEQLARHKLVEELLDEVVATGFLSFGSLRDAISRNYVKLDDLHDAGEFLEGDALIKADALFAVELDGIYQRSDFYLRGLQKVSSVPFGTRIGRLLTLFFVLPLGGSFLLLEGFAHVVGPLLTRVGVPPFDWLTLPSFLGMAVFLLALLHSAPFRALTRQVLEVSGMLLATLFFELPRALLAHPLTQRLLEQPLVRLVIRRLIVPGVLAVVAYFTLPFDRPQVRFGAASAVFVVLNLFLGSALGTWLEDLAVVQIAPTWKLLSRQWLPGMVRIVARFFAALMDLLQQAIYRVDELLRFREGESRVVLFVKGGVGFVWALVAYIVRLYMTLLVEPEINPLKHFPVVTVAHKLLLPFTPELLVAVGAPLKPFGSVVGGAVAGVTVFLLPSVFGFLAWELKENWKLYRATRPAMLVPSLVGPHGETMRGLLVPGLHSGTLPKLYERLRRAAQREDETALAGMIFRRATTADKGDGLGRFREGIRGAAQGVRRFVERELVAQLASAPRWSFGELRVVQVDLSSNRVRIQIACDGLGREPCTVSIDEQSGQLVAGIADAGFVTRLGERDAVASRLFENALAGLYQRAEVDLVREQIEAELGENAHYDISDEGLVVWPGPDFRTEIVYRLHRKVGTSLAPRVRGEAPAEPPRVLDIRRLLYRSQPISWLSWVGAWEAAAHPSAEVPRLLQGATILPRTAAKATPELASESA